MASITTKFDIGQRVFCASIVSTREQWPCPDCQGVKTWKASSPAGRDYEIACPRCSSGYLSEHRLHLSYAKWVPAVTPLTLCEVHGLNPVSYMALETSNGAPGQRGGSIHDEERLFLTEAEALVAAQIQSDEANAREQERLMKSPMEVMRIAVNDYHITDAMVALAEKTARDTRYDFEDFGNRLGDLLEETWLGRDEMVAKIRKMIGEQWSEHPAASELVDQ